MVSFLHFYTQLLLEVNENQLRLVEFPFNLLSSSNQRRTRNNPIQTITFKVFTKQTNKKLSHLQKKVSLNIRNYVKFFNTKGAPMTFRLSTRLTLI